MKSREKIDTVRGVDEHENFKSKQWEDKNGNPCYNFWDIDAEHPRTAVNSTHQVVGLLLFFGGMYTTLMCLPGYAERL